MFASMFKDQFVFNITPKDGEWLSWNGTVWEIDHKSLSASAAVEECALEYQRMVEPLKKEVEEQEIDKKHPDAWKLNLMKKYQSRIDRLRGRDGVGKVLHWAPIVEKSMACREEHFDRNPWLLPCRNGVIDLKTGTLTKGRPADLMTKCLDIDYDPHADYALWIKVLQEITDSEKEMPEFLKRSFGYAATGHAYEQYIWVFLGPGRNGKGIIFNLIGEILRPFFHTINASMLLEQRNPPSPAAASEHYYSLLAKRLVAGSETNKGKKIDGAVVKELTGEDEINCRPNFKSEINFYPTHTLMLRTQYVPYGMTQDFAMRERLLLIDFPFRYVDDVETHKKKEPQFADKFRQKDKHLKDKLREIKPGILRWIVEGCREWQEQGLAPPKQVLDAVDTLGREEDYVGRFISDCLVRFPDQVNHIKIPCKDMFSVFEWWWQGNEGAHEQRMPAMKTVNKSLREHGFVVDGKGGVTYVWGCSISLDVLEMMHKQKGGNR
jgi:putative DNA primase/helicase